MAATPPPRTLPLDQVVNKYKNMDDETLINKLFGQIQSYVILHLHGPLKRETLAEYRASGAATLLRALADENTRVKRKTLPSLIELILKSHGPRIIFDYVTMPSERRKVAVVMCSWASRAIPELSKADRATVQATWQGALSQARAAYEAQRRACEGFGGRVKDLGTSWNAIQDAIAELEPGHPDRLLLMLFTELRFRGTQMHCTPLLNFGHVHVFLPSQKGSAPSPQMIQKWAVDEEKPRGWLILDSDMRRDQLFLVLGFETDDRGECVTIVEQVRLTATLSKELRLYLATRRPSVKYLFTSAKHSINISNSEPYTGATGRSSWNAKINRTLMRLLGCRMRDFRVAITLHKTQQAKADLLAPEMSS